jgi:DNA-binding transcriptional LysR family regulator
LSPDRPFDDWRSALEAVQRCTARREHVRCGAVRDPIDWEDLRYFLRAAETKSLSGAARRMGVKHTTLGRRLSSLERSLGATVVTRGPSGLELTPLGERLLPLAAEIDRVVASIAEIAGDDRKNVRLVVPTGFTSLLTPHLSAFRRKAPELALEIVSGARRADVRQGEADLALRVGPVEDEELVVRKAGVVGSALYASRDYLARAGAVDPDDLAGHDVIAFHRSLGGYPGATWLEARSRRASIAMRSREAADMVEAAKASAGVAVLPCFLADAEPSLVRLTRELVTTRAIALVYRRESRRSREVQAVARFVTDVLTRSAARLRGD